MHCLIPVHSTTDTHMAQDPSGGLARCCLQAVTQRLGAALGSPHSWQHRELRNPLGDAALPPALQLSPAGALALQSFANQLLQAAPGGQRLVHGLLLLYGPHLLWSSLPPRDTAALFALISTGLLHARASSGGSGANGGVGDTAAAAPLDLRPLDGGGWQQLPSGFLALRDSLDAAITGEGAPAVQVPLVHLQQAPSPDQAGGQGQQAAAQAGQPMLAQPTPLQPCHLLPLLEGKLLVGLLLEGSTPLTSQLLAALHSLLAAPTRQMAAQVHLAWRSLRLLLVVCTQRGLPVGCFVSGWAAVAARGCTIGRQQPRPPSYPNLSHTCRLARRCVWATKERLLTCLAFDTSTRTLGWGRPTPPLASRSAP